VCMCTSFSLDSEEVSHPNETPSLASLTKMAQAMSGRTARDRHVARLRSNEARMKTLEITLREMEVEVEDMLSRKGLIAEELRLLEDDRRHLAWRRSELLHDIDVYSRQREWAVELNSCRAENEALRAEISDLLSSSSRDGDDENERRAATKEAHEDYESSDLWDLVNVNEYGTIEGATKKRDQPIFVASSSAATAKMIVRMMGMVHSHLASKAIRYRLTHQKHVSSKMVRRTECRVAMMWVTSPMISNTATWMKYLIMGQKLAKSKKGRISKRGPCSLEMMKEKSGQQRKETSPCFGRLQPPPQYTMYVEYAHVFFLLHLQSQRDGLMFSKCASNEQMKTRNSVSASTTATEMTQKLIVSPRGTSSTSPTPRRPSRDPMVSPTETPRNARTASPTKIPFNVRILRTIPYLFYIFSHRICLTSHAFPKL
jgi:hypothetical protein